MADEEARVGGRRRLAEGRHVVGEPGIAEILGSAEEIEGRQDGAAGAERRKADSAVAGDDGGDALARLRGHVPVEEEEIVVVGVGVDEAGGDDAPRRVDGARRRRPTELADGRDAVARDGDIGPLARRPCPVDHRPALEEDVVLLPLRSPGHHRLPCSRLSFSENHGSPRSHGPTSCRRP